MKLTVKNLGPITKGGTIDLDKRFYVFVGKNGSGKTYLANLLYGVFGSSRLESNQHFAKVEDSTDDFIFTNTKPFVTLDKKMFSTLVLEKSKFINISHPIIKQSGLLLDIPYEKDFVPKNFELTIFDEKEKASYIFTKESNSAEIKLKKENDINKPFESYTLPRGNSFNTFFWDYLLPNWLRKTSDDIILLPADRASFLSLWKYIVSVERSEKDLLYKKHFDGILLSNEELKNFQTPYIDSTKDLINRLERFDFSVTQEIFTYKDLVLELEDLMGGKINVKEGREGIGRKRFVFEMKENGEAIELFLASSAVNQLSILYLYLKFLAKPTNNSLIIDEPEINLHPENQIKLLNILMKFADRNDNRVLITTHSTLMADAVNNHVRIEYLQEKGASKAQWLKEHKLEALDNIRHQDFGVYYFSGDSIEEYPVGDYGVAFKDFATTIQKVDKLADELNDEIYSSLHEKEE